MVYMFVMYKIAQSYCLSIKLYLQPPPLIGGVWLFYNIHVKGVKEVKGPDEESWLIAIVIFFFNSLAIVYQHRISYSCQYNWLQCYSDYVICCHMYRHKWGYQRLNLHLFSYLQHLGTIQLQIVWNKLFSLLQEINNRFTPSIFGATFRDIDDGDDTTSTWLVQWLAPSKLPRWASPLVWQNISVYPMT